MTTEQIRVLIDASQRLSMARSLETVMEVVRISARKLTGADGATFVLRDNDLCYYVDEDAIAPLWKGQRFPMSACISGWCMMNRESIRIPDVYKYDRIPLEAYRTTFVKSLVMVPIRTLDPIGAIGTYWAREYLPTDDEVYLLQSLADIASIAIENVYIYEDLERRVKLRTSELEQANAELEAFSFSVSHDLRSPLQAMGQRIRIFLEEHEKAMPETEALSLIQSVLKVTEGMDDLVTGLLDFARFTKKEVVEDHLPMKEMVDGICRELLEREASRDIQFHVADLPDARGDKVLIRQVWINLLQNAVKFTLKNKQAEITVDFYEDETEGIIYRVKDNGVGFNMKYYDKLFGILERLHSNPEFSGSGIGLALIRRILARHGGRIWAEGKVNQGAVFCFSLPPPDRRNAS